MNVYVVQRHFEDSEGFSIEGVYASREGAGLAVSMNARLGVRTVEEYEVGVWQDLTKERAE